MSDPLKEFVYRGLAAQRLINGLTPGRGGRLFRAALFDAAVQLPIEDYLSRLAEELHGMANDLSLHLGQIAAARPEWKAIIEQLHYDAGFIRIFAAQDRRRAAPREK